MGVAIMRTLPVVVAALLVSSSSFAFEFKRDSSGQAVRWARAVEFVADASLNDKLSEPQALAAIGTAFTELRSSSGAPVTVAAGQTTGMGYDFAEPSANQSEIIALDEWEYDANAIAVTVVTVDAKTHAIVDADIALNLATRQFRVLPAGSQANGTTAFDDVQNTVTHEVGHAVGLAHEPDLPSAVMYPSARRGEISKRTLSGDDVLGLSQLYGSAPASELSNAASADEASAGCSAAGMSGLWPLGLGALSLLWRRRKLALLATAALSTAAVAAERTEAPVAEASQAVQAEVVSRRTLEPKPGARVLKTELRLKTTDCLKGACPDEWVVVVPGGRYGDYEQSVEGLTVPEAGEKVAFTVKSSRIQLYRMGHAPDRVAFFKGLVRAQARTESSPPQR